MVMEPKQKYLFKVGNIYGFFRKIGFECDEKVRKDMNLERFGKVSSYTGSLYHALFVSILYDFDEVLEYVKSLEKEIKEPKPAIPMIKVTATNPEHWWIQFTVPDNNAKNVGEMLEAINQFGTLVRTRRIEPNGYSYSLRVAFRFDFEAVVNTLCDIETNGFDGSVERSRGKLFW